MEPNSDNQPVEPQYPPYIDGVTPVEKHYSKIKKKKKEEKFKQRLETSPIKSMLKKGNGRNNNTINDAKWKKNITETAYQRT